MILLLPFETLVTAEKGINMQVIHNTLQGEYYCVDRDKKFTIQCDNKKWSCSCCKPNCEHIKAVQEYLNEEKRERF